MNISLNKLLKMAMLCAIALVLIAYLHFPIFPQANYLLYDPADVLLLIGAFLFGPLAGLLMTVVTALIQALLITPEGGWVGFVMHVIASGTLVLTAGFIYKIRKTRGFALIGLCSRRRRHGGHYDTCKPYIHSEFLRRALRSHDSRTACNDSV